MYMQDDKCILSLHLHCCICIFSSPVKAHLDLKTNMEMVGKRFPFLATYKVQLLVQSVIP